MRKCLLALILGMLFMASPVIAQSVPTMDKDELKSMLGSEELVILDVRLGRDWSTSEFKIEGAIRFDGRDFTPIKDMSKEKTYVLYCA